MSSKITIELLDKIQDGFNRHDVDGILSHFADDCIWVMASGPTAPDGRICHGKDEIADVLTTRYAEITDMRWDDINHWICDDTKAMSEWIVRGTKDGTPFEFTGCDLWEFKDGMVTKKDTYWKIIA